MWFSLILYIGPLIWGDAKTFFSLSPPIVSQPQVYGYPCDPLAIVPIMGVYNKFLGASGPIKKTGKFCYFKILFFFAITLPKMVKSSQNQSHPTHLSKTYLNAKFQLIWPSNRRENKKYTLFLGSDTLFDLFGFSLLFCPFFGNFLAIFCHFRSDNWVLVLMASFGPFS